MKNTIHLVKQVYGNGGGLLVGIYGANRGEIVEAGNLLFNWGIAATALEENETNQAGVGFWSDTFAVVQCNGEKLCKFFKSVQFLHLKRKALSHNLAPVMEKLVGALRQLADAKGQAQFDAIPREEMLSNSGEAMLQLEAYAMGENRIETCENIGDDVYTSAIERGEANNGD